MRAETVGIWACAALVLAACVERHPRTQLSLPATDAASLVVVAEFPDGARVFALTGSSRSDFVLQADQVLGDEVRFHVLAYEEDLAARGLAAGEYAVASEGRVSVPLPTPDGVYFAELLGFRLGDWSSRPIQEVPDVRLTCAPGFHDGGDGVCAPAGQCNPGFVLDSRAGCLPACTTATLGMTCLVECSGGLACTPFGELWTVDLEDDVTTVAAVDTDGDERAEIIVARLEDVSFYSGAGFPPQLSIKNEYGPGEFIRGLGTGDVDNDGRTEIMLGGWQAPLRQFSGTPPFELEREIPRPGSNGFWTFAIDDVDADGIKEMITADRYGRFYVYRDEGQGAVRVFTSPRFDNPEAVDTSTAGAGKTALTGVGDTNGDGTLEIVTYGAFGVLDVWTTDGNGGFTQTYHRAFAAGYESGAIPGRSLLADLDADGDDEIIYVDDFGRMEALDFEGGGYEVAWSLDLGAVLKDGTRFDVSSMAIGDVDGDPELEIVIGGLLHRLGISSRVWVVDSDTRLVSELPLGDFGQGRSSVAVAPMSGAKDEVLIGTAGGQVRIFSAHPRSFAGVELVTVQ